MSKIVLKSERRRKCGVHSHENGRAHSLFLEYTIRPDYIYIYIYIYMYIY